jgi:hypothetical protein
MVYYWLMDEMGLFLIRMKLQALTLMLANDPADAASQVRVELASLGAVTGLPIDIVDEIGTLWALVAPTSIVSGVN